MLYGFCEEKLRQSLIILTCYRNAVFLALIKHLKLVSGPHSDEHTTHMGPQPPMQEEAPSCQSLVSA